MISWIFTLALAVTSPFRADLPLDGPWLATADDPFDVAAQWRQIEVPGTAQEVFGAGFEGVTAWRKVFLLPDDFRAERILVHFDAVATEAHVFLNDELAGTHVGLWTPFRVDVTDQVVRGGRNVLLVVVDTNAGHDTEGFLPTIQARFSGIWQPVRLMGVAATSINDLAVLAAGDPATSTMTVEAPVLGPAGGAIDLGGGLVLAEVRIGERVFQKSLSGDRAEIACEDFEAWDVDHPSLYTVRFRLFDERGSERDRVDVQAAFRSVTTRDRSLLINGRPLNVRGILDWGYYPPHLAPDPPDHVIRKHLREARQRGFNLVKFGLWVPPTRILRLLDQEGMLAWQEYPTWRAHFDEDHRTALVAEFEEFFARDRNHPAVILRSLTCESGPSASLEVLTELYDTAHDRIPGAIVEDDSSWIEWNRVCDFYDDHAYGNNRDLVERLAVVDEFIEQRESKPLVLGEAFAANTWLNRSQVSAAASRNAYWLPICFDAQVKWESRMRDRFGPRPLRELSEWSLRFAMNLRKSQIETFRRMRPEGGYVVAVARDFRLAQMGLRDQLDRWKWPAREWSWHGDSMLLLGPSAPTAIRAGTATYIELLLTHHGAEYLPPGRLAWSFGGQDGDTHGGEFDVAMQAPGTVQIVATPSLRGPPVDTPTPLELEVQLIVDGQTIENRWTFWAIPEDRSATDHRVLVTRSLDAESWQRLREGAAVIVLAGDEPGSFTAKDTWLLRGSPWFPSHPITERIAPEFFLDLVPRDLAPSGLLPLTEVFPHVEPIVAFWEAHDTADVRDWGLAWETRVEKGRLLVTSLDLESSIAGDWLLRSFIEHVRHGQKPLVEFPPTLVEAVQDRLEEKSIDLTKRMWELRPGVPGQSDEWIPVQIGRDWESQGFESLDGQATYRVDVDVPREWAGEPLFLHLGGVDDAGEVRFDDVPCGNLGDAEARVPAPTEAAGLRLSEAVEPGQHRIEVRVFDFGGSGGLIGSAALSTRPGGPASSFLNSR